MPRSYITSRHDALYADAVYGLFSDLGKKVVVQLLPAATDAVFCGNCIWDPVHQCSTGNYNRTGPQPFTGKVCPVCSGKGRISQMQPVRVPDAIVRFGRVTQTDGKMFMPEGELPHGFARLRAKIRWLAPAQTAQCWYLDGVRHSRVGEVRKRGLKTNVIIEVLLRQDE